MQEYCKYELPTLVDLLAKETSVYTKMIAAGINGGDDFNKCKSQINKIQAAIFWKKQRYRIFNKRSPDNDMLFSF